MPKLVPHLWYAKEAVEAAKFYESVFKASSIGRISKIKDTPSGDCDIVSFSLMGHEFRAISAGPVFTFNPSISFMVTCHTPDDVDRLWEGLIRGGKPLMDLGGYPFSNRYGWLEDKYGLSWQIIHLEGQRAVTKIMPTMMFTGDVCGKAEEAMRLYTSIFPNSNVSTLHRYEEGEAPDQAGTVKHAQFSLDGVAFAAMDSAWPHEFAFNEAISFIVQCKDQVEINYYWEKMSAVPEAEQCGWIKDKFGVSWQIVPENMDELMAKNPEKTTPAMLGMKKLIIAELVKAGQ